MSSSSSGSSRKRSQSNRVAHAQQAAAGVEKYFASMPSLVMAAVTYTPAELVTLLQGYGPTVTALQLLHSQLHDAVVAEKGQAAKIDELLTELEVFVVNQFGRKAGQVTEFGYTPHKVPVLTAAQKGAARAKAAATRKAKKTALAAVGTPAAPPAATQSVTNGAPVKA